MMKKDPKNSWFAEILAVMAAMLCREVDTGNLFMDNVTEKDGDSCVMPS